MVFLWLKTVGAPARRRGLRPECRKRSKCYPSLSNRRRALRLPDRLPETTHLLPRTTHLRVWPCKACRPAILTDTNEVHNIARFLGVATMKTTLRKLILASALAGCAIIFNALAPAAAALPPAANAAASKSPTGDTGIAWFKGDVNAAFV